MYFEEIMLENFCKTSRFTWSHIAFGYDITCKEAQNFGYKPMKMNTEIK